MGPANKNPAEGEASHLNPEAELLSDESRLRIQPESSWGPSPHREAPDTNAGVFPPKKRSAIGESAEAKTQDDLKPS